MICNESSVSYFVVRVQPSSLYTIDSLGPAGARNSLSGWSLWFLLFYYYYFIYFILLSNYLLFIYCFIIGKTQSLVWQKTVFWDLMICLKSLKSWFDKSVKSIINHDFDDIIFTKKIVSCFIASNLECWLTNSDKNQIIMETLLLVYYFWPWPYKSSFYLYICNIVLPGSMDSLYYAGNNSTIPKYNFSNMTIWKWHDLFRIID